MMAETTSLYATQLRRELTLRNRVWARRCAHVESYGTVPVIVYEPDGRRHGNFFDAAYASILARPEWLRRFDKVHAQAARSLPKSSRRWRELDSSMSSDALLMNVFCAPGVAESTAVRILLGVDDSAEPIFGWKARVPLTHEKFDRTEVDMRFGSLLVEAKLTEADFQSRAAAIVESYRDFSEVFDRDRLPRAEIAKARWMRASEFPENVSQEFESVVADPTLFTAIDGSFRPPGEEGYASYQLIRNVLAAYATGASFCVFHDERRPDLREAWFAVMAAVKISGLRTHLKVLTWQELAAVLPAELQEFLDLKYGITAPGREPSPLELAS
ncbi:MAG: PGN_0703 family putative restriction endonuclease [Terracidiphilus sp.]